MYSTAQVADYLRVSTNRVRQFVQEGRLNPKRIGNSLCFLDDDIRQFAKTKRQCGRPKAKANKAARIPK